MDLGKKDTGREISIYLSGAIAISLLQFALLPVLTRALGPAGFGKFELANAVLGLLVPLMGVGVAPTVAYFYVRRNPDERLGASLLHMLVVAVGLWTMIIPFAYLLFDHFGSRILSGAIDYLLFTILLGIAALTLINDLFMNVLRMKRLALLKVSVEVAAILVFFLFAIRLAFHSQSPILDLFLLKLLILIGVAGAAFFSFKRYFRKLSFQVNFLEVKQIIKIALPFLISTLSAWIFSASDRLVISNVATMADLGLYALGTRLAAMWEIVIVSSILSAFVPRLYQLFSINLGEGQKAVFKTLCWYIAFCLVSYVLIFPISDFAFAPVLGTAFVPARPFFLVSLVGYMFIGCFYLVTQRIHYLGKSFIVVAIFVTCTLLNLCLNLIFVPRFGAIAASVSSAATQFLMFLFGFFAQSRLGRKTFEKN